MSLQKTIKNIQSLKIQGASAVARATLLEMKRFGKAIKSVTPVNFVKEIEKVGESLAYARPTEPMAQNLVEGIVARLKQVQKARANTKDLKEVLDFLVSHDLKHIEEELKQVVEGGVKIIKSQDKILTFCHSSTVEGVLIMARKQGKRFKVFVPETRPLFQGRITARNLSQAKIDVTMILDSVTDQLLNAKEVNKVLIGADVIFKDGSIVNKVGSFGICEDAHQNEIPVYAAASLLKLKPEEEVKIERREFSEVWSKAPKRVRVVNLAFEKVPAKFITGIVTERGILKPGQVKKS